MTRNPKNTPNRSSNHRQGLAGNRNVSRSSQQVNRDRSSAYNDRADTGGRPEQFETGFHNEHYRAGFEAGRAYHHHYGYGAGETTRRASDNNLNGPRDDDRSRDSDRADGDYGDTVYRSDNEGYRSDQRGDGNLGRSRTDWSPDSDRDDAVQSSSSRDRELELVGTERGNRSSNARSSSRSRKSSARKS